MGAILFRFGTVDQLNQSVNRSATVYMLPPLLFVRVAMDLCFLSQKYLTHRMLVGKVLVVDKVLEGLQIYDVISVSNEQRQNFVF